MIQITFNFNDIAAAAALFAKLNGHEIGAMQALHVPAPDKLVHSSAVSADEKAAVVATEAPGKRAAKPVATEPTAQASDASQPSSSEASPTTQPAAAAVAYPDLQKAVLTLHKQDPSAAVPIAKSLGADTFKLLKPEQWAEALRLVNAKIAELQAG